jgi:hypothetical protein
MASPTKGFTVCSGKTSFALASGHSPERMLYMTVSRMVPSQGVAAQHATLSAQALDGCWDAEVEVVGAPATWQRFRRRGSSAVCRW